MPRRKRHPSFVRAYPWQRTGLTLLEMLLVLALLVVALAVLYPATERLYRTHRFQQATQRLRGRLAAARVRSIDDGLIYQFRYEPRGRRLLVMPYGQQANARDRDNDEDSSGAAKPGNWRLSAQLPRSVRFGTFAAATERVARARLNGFADADGLAAASWSRPILFFPDGSATDARIPIGDSDGRRLELRIRGLTGTTETVKRLR